MPEVNGSIPASVNVPQNDLFGTIGKAIALKTGLLQNRMLQQDFSARQGAGEAYQQSIDPQSGELDTNKFMGFIASDPRTAYKAGEYAKEGQDRTLQQANITSAQAKAYNDHFGLVGAALTPILAGDDFSREGILSHAVNFLGNSAVQPELRKGVQGDIIQLAQQLTDDPEKNKQILTQIAIRNQDAQQRVQTLLGQVQARDTGPNITVQTESPVTGVHPLATMAKGLDPATGAQRVQTYVKDDKGNFVPVSIPQSEASQIGQLQTGPALTPGGLTPSEASERVKSYDPVTHQPITVPKGSVEYRGAGTAGAGSGALPAGPPLGATEGAAISAAESAKQGVALQQQADAAPARRAALLSMRDQLANFDTGPAADKLSHLAALANEFHVPWVVPTISPEKVKATEEFNKLSTQIVLQQVQQLGGAGTDDKLAAGIKGNPSTYLSKQGNRAVTALMLGNEQAITSKNEAWQKWQAAGKGPETYGQFSTQFNRIYDPRVFQAQYMDKADRATMIKNMTPAEKKAYDDHVRIAVQAGWIK